MARTCGFDDGGFAPLTPRAPRMMIGAHVSGVAKEDLGLFSLRQGFDLRVVLLEPLLDQSLVALLRTVILRAVPPVRTSILRSSIFSDQSRSVFSRLSAGLSDSRNDLAGTYVSVEASRSPIE